MNQAGSQGQHSVRRPRNVPGIVGCGIAPGRRVAAGFSAGPDR